MSSVNNKRIAKNTIYLYLRMLFVMAVGLYTVRAILNILGVVDYGLYNVVGEMVTMFAFMNKTLSTSSQRYFSVALAKNDRENLKRVFSLNLTMFSILGAIVVFLLETVGLWFVNNKMTIPPERMMAANVVYQLSILSMIFQILVVPYMALVIAYEKMGVFAIIGMVEAIGKLGIVFFLTVFYLDKLIIYAILVLLLAVGTSMWYVIYCLKHYSESHFRWYWNKQEALELLGFSGWHFMGTFTATCRSQGINILINLFFNLTVNAARAVSYQVYSAVFQLVNNFFTAVKPQLYKSYGEGQLEDMYKLINRSTIICTYLLSILVFPLMANTEFILEWWLKEVPGYTVVFTQLVLINGLVDAINLPLTASALATGKIRKYEITLCSINLLNIPVSYIAFKLGAPPYVTMVISIILACASVIARAIILKGMIQLSLHSYFKIVSRILIVIAIMIVIVKMDIIDRVDSFVGLMLYSCAIVITLTGFYSLIIDRIDRQLILCMVKNYWCPTKN